MAILTLTHSCLCLVHASLLVDVSASLFAWWTKAPSILGLQVTSRLYSLLSWPTPKRLEGEFGLRGQKLTQRTDSLHGWRPVLRRLGVTQSTAY